MFQMLTCAGGNRCSEESWWVLLIAASLNAAAQVVTRVKRATRCDGRLLHGLAERRST
jgi:hypothetical protein